MDNTLLVGYKVSHSHAAESDGAIATERLDTLRTLRQALASRNGEGLISHDQVHSPMP